MKKFNLILALIFTSIFISCSSGQNLKEENKIESEFEDSVALEDENQYEDEESIDEGSYSDDTIEEQEDEVASNTLEPVETFKEPQQAVKIDAQSGSLTDYTVKKGETLMLIAFQLYGDYSRWREIRDQNPQLASYQNLSEGQKLKVVMPDTNHSFRPDGLPYLIKTNDTLQVISNNVYDTSKKWMQIYKHNDALIKNPNVIYAGFTIYYLEDGNYNRTPANN
jgi:LysM repeat protein